MLQHAALVFGNQHLFVGATIIDQQARANKIREVRDARALGDRLPVDDRYCHRAVGTFAKQQVIEPIIAVHCGVHLREAREIVARVGHESGAEFDYVVFEPVGVTLTEPRVESLIEGGVALYKIFGWFTQPRHFLEHGVAPQRAVQTSELVDRRQRVFNGAARQLIALQ